MTREEAIRWLENIHRRFNPTGENLENEGGDVHLQALDMAIEALAEPKTGKCKDCTHWDKLDYEAPRQGWCYQFEEFTDADEYCSRCAMMRGESHEVCVYR